MTPRWEITWPAAVICIAGIAGTVVVLVTHSLPPEWVHTLAGAWVGFGSGWLLRPPIKLGPGPEQKEDGHG